MYFIYIWRCHAVNASTWPYHKNVFEDIKPTKTWQKKGARGYERVLGFCGLTQCKGNNFTWEQTPQTPWEPSGVSRPQIPHWNSPSASVQRYPIGEHFSFFYLCCVFYDVFTHLLLSTTLYKSCYKGKQNCTCQIIILNYLFSGTRRSYVEWRFYFVNYWFYTPIHFL